MDTDGHHHQGHERNQSRDHDHSHGTEGKNKAEVSDEVLSTFILIGI